MALEDRFRDTSIIVPFHFPLTACLREMMQQTRAVISGSAALLLLHDVEFTLCDLDFYVPARGFPSVLSFVQKFGYEIDSPTSLQTGQSHYRMAD